MRLITMNYKFYHLVITTNNFFAHVNELIKVQLHHSHVTGQFTVMHTIFAIL